MGSAPRPLLPVPAMQQKSIAGSSSSLLQHTAEGIDCVQLGFSKLKDLAVAHRYTAGEWARRLVRTRGQGWQPRRAAWSSLPEFGEPSRPAARSAGQTARSAAYRGRIMYFQNTDGIVGPTAFSMISLQMPVENSIPGEAIAIRYPARGHHRYSRIVQASSAKLEYRVK